MRQLPNSKQKKSSRVSSGIVTRDSKKNSGTLSPHKVPSSYKKTTKKVSSPYLKTIKRYTKYGVRATLLSPFFHSAVKVVVIGIVVSSALYGSYHYINKTFANEIVISQGEIIARVAKLTDLPKEPPVEIVRVQDGDDLRKQNVFYKDVKEGDYIIMYKNMAVIYDLRNNAIVAIKRSN